MSTALWWVPLTAGFQDGINPCTLMNAALILLGIIWLKKSGFSRYWFLLLLVSMLFSTFIINCGLLDKYLLNKYFVTIVRWSYALLAVLVGAQGLQFFKQWIRLIKKEELKPEIFRLIKLSPLALGFLISLTGGLLSLLASLWPVNYYISVFGVYMSMPGQLVPMGFLIAVYTVMSFWVIYLVIAVTLLESRNQRLFKIMSASILFSACLSVVGLFL